MKREPPTCPLGCGPGFSLLEVIVAIGIFGAGIVTLLALFGSVAKSIGANSDVTAAADLGDLLQVHLQSRIAVQRSLEPVRSLLQASTAGAAEERGRLYASRDGAVIAEDGDPTWAGRDSEKYFSIALVPVEGAGADAALLLPYVAKVRWPAVVRVIGGEFVPASAASQQEIFLAGAVVR